MTTVSPLEADLLKNRPFCVALTGGIASGKTAVSDYFASLGVAIIDTDIIARDVVTPGQPGLKSIVETFGASCLDENGELNRTALREVISNNDSARHQLEAILHPLIYTESIKQIKNSTNAPYVMIVVPLLVETGLFDWVDRVVVVDVDEATQLERLQKRDNMTLEGAKKMLATQATRQQRLSKADDVILNNDDLAGLYKQCEGVHKHYSQIARAI